MKINKLQIFNIASIASVYDADAKEERPQEIVFDQSPLADSDVYLITGDTGAGKSTILDAMCLALFNNTPRMKTRKNESVQTGIDELTLKDTRRLMRRNTGEAYARLFFVGIDGNEYIAEWHVQRGKSKKTTVQVNSVSRSLKNITKNQEITSNSSRQEGELQEKISAAIGLDFDQFCRTTMLAQGEFTRFLSSSEDERAEILEKITQTEKFAKAGAKLYEIITQKEKDWKAAEEAAGKTGLSDEEIEGKNKEKKDLEDDNKSLVSTKDEAAKKQRWLEIEKTLAEALDKALKDYNVAQQELESDDFKQKENFAKQWNDTIDARAWLALMKGAEKRKQEAAGEIRDMKTRYLTLLNGQKSLADRIDNIKAEIDSLDTSLKEDEPLEAMYEQAQTIGGYLQIMQDGKEKKNELERQLAEDEHRRDEQLKPECTKKEDALKSAQEKDESLEKEINEKQKEIDALKLDKLRQEKEKLGTMILDIRQALLELQNLETAKQRWKEEEKKLQDALAAIDGLRKELNEKAKPQYDIAKAKKEACEKVMDSLKDSVDAFAKLMRAKLTEGCDCPVCRQKVVMLPDEALLDDLFVKAKEDYDKAKEDYDKAEKLKNITESKLKADEARYNEDLQRHQADISVKEAEKKTLEACKKCDIVTLSADTKTDLEKTQTEMHKRVESIEPTIKEGEGLESQLRKLRDDKQQQSKVVETARRAFDEAKKDLDDCENELKSKGVLLTEKKNAIQKAQDDAAPLMVATAWNMDWTDRPGEVKEKLSSSAKQYDKKKQRKQDLESEVSKAMSLKDAIGETVCQICKQMPGWAVLSAEASTPMSDLSKQAASLLTDSVAKKNTYTEAQKQQTENNDNLNVFLADHPELSLERLEQLNQTNSVETLVAKLNGLRDKKKEKEGQLMSARENHDNHQDGKPVLVEGETIETLGVTVKKAENAINNNNQCIGVINKELADDAKLKAGLGALRQVADEARAVYEKWNRLAPLSDKEGRKFRKIAQSLIFESLLETANYYLQKLEPRYVLKVVPGTLYSALEDAYQGFAERDTGSLSGGESFLVSLALALALSEIGQGLEVDTLFIDEGFGSLSGVPLTNAIQTLRSIRGQRGRHVGVISHIQEVRDNIPVQIQVNKTIDGSSSLIDVAVVQ